MSCCMRTENNKYSPNENYGREVMELFTLGADRGYTQHDVHQQARALTGFTNSWSGSLGPHDFRFALTAAIVRTRFASADWIPFCATAMKIASMMLSWAMRAAAFSLVREEPCAVAQSTTSLISAIGEEA